MNIVGEMMIKIHLHKYLSTPSIVNKVKNLERAVPQSSSITSVEARLISQLHWPALRWNSIVYENKFDNITLYVVW